MPRGPPIGFQRLQKWPLEAITWESFPGDNIKCLFLGALGPTLDAFRAPRSTKRGPREPQGTTSDGGQSTCSGKDGTTGCQQLLTEEWPLPEASSFPPANAEVLSTKDETAHYLICPILMGIISQACCLDHLPTLHELIFGNDKEDVTGALACAIGYHIYHSLKFGKMPELSKAIESSRFSCTRAFAFSSAKAFMNDFDIQSNGVTFKCGRHPDLQRVSTLNSRHDQSASNSHYQGLLSPVTPT